MTTPMPSAPFSVANPHALATILDAAQTQSIIASRDIFDIGGTKLWARDLPVSHALQRKLLDRQLRDPLETCLTAEHGITTRSLVEALEMQLAELSPLTGLLKPCAQKLVLGAGHLPLHPVVQLLLTAGRAARPETFDHAVQAMALAGTLAINANADVRTVRLAMLAGLVHDLGELYIDPQFKDAEGRDGLDVLGFQQLVVHPHIGRLLIDQLTDYPSEVARAVAEHHERLDGSGYPHRLTHTQLSPLGRLIAVVECTLGVMRNRQVPLHRASVALRVVPGEFDARWSGLVAQVAAERAMEPAQAPLPELVKRLDRLDEALQSAQDQAAALAQMARTNAFRDAMGLAHYLLQRLRVGWNASGLWARGAMVEQDRPELECVEGELRFRLRSTRCAVMLRAGQLSDEEALALAQFSESLGEALPI